MRGNVLKGLLFVVGVFGLALVSGDRRLEAQPPVCLLCTGPQCWCEVRFDSFCDGVDPDMTCKCNAE